jgi:ATP-binding cassette subfamily B protein
LTVDSSIHEEPDAVEANIHSGQIEFRNVSFTYDSDKPKEDQINVLHNISFTVPAGQSVAIVGATGSGKSTCMRLLYRFYELQEGQILIDGIDIKKMRINDLRSSIAIVP